MIFVIIGGIEHMIKSNRKIADCYEKNLTMNPPNMLYALFL